MYPYNVYCLSVLLQERKKIVNILLFHTFIMNSRTSRRNFPENIHLCMSSKTQIRVKEQSLGSKHAWSSTAFSNNRKSLFYNYIIKAMIASSHTKVMVYHSHWLVASHYSIVHSKVSSVTMGSVTQYESSKKKTRPFKHHMSIKYLVS